MMLVAILAVRTDAPEAFGLFERHAAGVMEAHGGRLAVRADPREARPCIPSSGSARAGRYHAVS